MKIVADEHIPFIKEYFSGYGELILKPGRSINANDVQDADVLLVRSITKVDADLLQNSSVKFVGSVTSGVDHLDIEWFETQGILWAAAFGFNAPAVADYVISCIAALMKKKLLASKTIRAAVIGVGQVGQLVAERLKNLGYTIFLCDPFKAESDKNVHYTALDDLTNLDFVSIHVPLTHAGRHPTYHLIDEKFIARQNKQCVIINTSRGAVIDSNVILNSNKELNWCLDVWENEPEINKDMLTAAVIATPHIAGYSVQSKQRGVANIHQLSVEKKILEELEIRPVEFSYNKIPSENNSWQEAVLKVFNPLEMTERMRTAILSAHDHGVIFDEMRHQFISRHEFAYTKCYTTTLSEEDKEILRILNFMEV